VDLFIEMPISPEGSNKTPTFDAISKVLRSCAVQLAQAEDRIIFEGPDALRGLANIGVNVRQPNNVLDGLLHVQPNVAEEVNQAAAGYPQSLHTAVGLAETALENSGYAKPFSLVLHDVLKSEGNLPAAPGGPSIVSQIKELIEGDVFASGQILVRQDNQNNEVWHYGLLAAPHGAQATIYIGQEPTLELTHIDGQGRYCFCLSERFQLVVRAPEAFHRIQVRRPAAAAPAPVRRGPLPPERVIAQPPRQGLPPRLAARMGCGDGHPPVQPQPALEEAAAARQRRDK